MKTLTFCIPCKNRTLQKVKNESGGIITLELLPKCLESIVNSRFTHINYEVVIVDFMSDDTDFKWLKDTLKDIPYKLLKVDGHFNRGQALNLASLEATGEILFFLDTDMLVTKGFIHKAIKCLKNKPAFFPICQDFKDSQHTKKFFRKNGFGNLLITSKCFNETDGWLEKDSWGGEDTDMKNQLKGLYQRKVILGFYHQWHPKGDFQTKHYRNKVKKVDMEYIKNINKKRKNQ